MAAKVLAGALDPVAAEVAAEGLAGALHSVTVGNTNRRDIDSSQVSPKPI